MNLIEIHAHENERLIAWATSIRVISLDLTVLFANELGLRIAMLDAIRELAREVLVSSGVARDYHADISKLECAFKKALHDSLGDTVTQEVIQWHLETFAMHNDQICVGQCFRVLSELIYFLGTTIVNAAPFTDRVTYTKYLSLASDIVDKHKKFHDDVFCVENITDWDRMMNESLGDNYIYNAILLTLDLRLACCSLPLLRSVLPSEGASIIQDWWNDHRLRNDCMKLIV